jgi:hypothetical protein
MFREAVIEKKRGRDIVTELVYERFTLETNYPQNVCLMKDGSVVFCEEFVKLTADEKEPPQIVGLKFLQVIFVIFILVQFIFSYF